jgi:hypothetical protein
VTFYEIGGKYYLDVQDIKDFTRCKIEETPGSVKLTQGIREIEIKKISGRMTDSMTGDQGFIPFEYDGKHLCEGIPMLIYLGAECSLQGGVLEVLMPDITVWESLPPDQADYCRNIAQLYGRYSIEKLKNIFTFYYRAATLVSENMAKLTSVFGGKNKDEWVGYFNAAAENMAVYLQRITNCAAAPLTDYSRLSDRLITSAWIKDYEKGLLAIMQSACEYPIYTYVYVDMDHDSASELIGVCFDDEKYVQTWYCSSDGAVCKLVHQSNFRWDGCEIKLINLEQKTHVVINSFRAMGPDGDYSIFTLRDSDIIYIISEKYGYVQQLGDDIGLMVQAYDGIIDFADGPLVGHSFKWTYLCFDGKKYKEYGAKLISETDFLKYENSQEIKDAAAQAMAAEFEPDRYGKYCIKYSYYIRTNGIIHIQCDAYFDSGAIYYGYFTVRYVNNTLTGEIGEYNKGQMAPTFSDLEVIY